MAAKVKKAVQTDYIACRVRFSADGVKLTFNPPWNNQVGKHHHNMAAYEAIVGPKRPAKPAPAAGAKAKLSNGKFNRKEHRHLVSKDRPTRLAFYLDDKTTWRFVKKGIDGKTVADKQRFSRHLVSPSGKVVEVTFTPEGKTKDYSYELWLQADVIEPGMVPDERPSVTIIIDPVLGGTGGIPPGGGG